MTTLQRFPCSTHFISSIPSVKVPDFWWWNKTRNMRFIPVKALKPSAAARAAKWRFVVFCFGNYTAVLVVARRLLRDLDFPLNFVRASIANGHRLSPSIHLQPKRDSRDFPYRYCC